MCKEEVEVEVDLSVAGMSALSDEAKLEMLKAGKGGEWYDGWAPYCLQCDTMQRMGKKEYGFSCSNCMNMIGWHMYRLTESPLNDPSYTKPRPRSIMDMMHAFSPTSS